MHAAITSPSLWYQSSRPGEPWRGTNHPHAHWNWVTPGEATVGLFLLCTTGNLNRRQCSFVRVISVSRRTDPQRQPKMCRGKNYRFYVNGQRFLYTIHCRYSHDLAAFVLKILSRQFWGIGNFRLDQDVMGACNFGASKILVKML